MALLERVLQPPSYGYEREGKLYVPTRKEIFREFFSRLNVFADRKNWVQAICWFASAAFAIPFFCFFFLYFSWTLVFVGFVYSMIILGTHGTIYFHRYSTHRAYKFRNRLSQALVRDMVIKIIPEELYVISHHVHHHIAEKPGDPYNVHGGWLYCFLADANHQPIAKDLSEAEYRQMTRLLDHTNVRLNTYAQYQKWGSLAHPGRTLVHFVVNWTCWYAAFYLLGGHALATAIFGASGFWAFGVRTFNFDGHGAGKDKRRDGIDFNRADLSINQKWPGLVTGEWHNNHHLYPTGARAGFLSYQWDTAWWFIRFYYAIGGIVSYRDYKEEFLEKYYRPYLLARHQKQLSPAV